jgi:hypothetical protein
MFCFRKLPATVIGLCIVQTVSAQHHYNAWFRGIFSVSAGKKLKIDNEFQHRRQNGFDNANLFEHNLMFTYRNWVHYQHNSTIKFSVSPFAYFSNFKIIQKQTEENATPSSEIRLSAATEMQHLILKKMYVVSRAAVEYRIFYISLPDILRLRGKLGFRYDFTENIALAVFDELLLNVNSPKKDHAFDHKPFWLATSKPR